MDFKGIMRESAEIRAKFPRVVTDPTYKEMGIYGNEKIMKEIDNLLKDIMRWNSKAGKILRKMKKGRRHQRILEQLAYYKRCANALDIYYSTILNRGWVLDENQRRRIWLEQANLAPIC